ncbi:MAG TPA: hypothetical protein VGP82_13205 [Ktedonobacterales bacterium]|nr:hypothetical protein [Ktedonobacterales bacterium]
MQPGAGMPGGGWPQPGYGSYVTTGQRPAPSQQDELQQVVEGAVTSFRKRLIDLSTMTWALRIITLLGFAQLVAIGVVLAIQGTFSAQMVIDHQDGRDIQVPIAVFVVGMVGLGLVWSALLTAALHSPWYLRFSALLFFTFWALLEDATGFPVGNNPAARVSDTVLTVLSIQAAILIGIWLRALVITFLNWRAGSTGISLNRERSIGATFLLLVVAIGVHYIAGYVASGAANNAPDQLTFSAIINIELGFLFVLLAPVLFITGTDFAEAGQTISNGVANFLRRRGAPGLLYSLTLLVALAITGYCIFAILDGPTIARLNLLGSADLLAPAIVVTAAVLLVFGAVVALLGWGLLQLTEVAFTTKRWPALDVPAWAYIAATTVVGVGFGIVTLLTVAGLPLVVVFVVPAIGLAVGLPLALRGRRQPGLWSVAGLFIILVSTLGVLAYGWVYSDQPTLQVLIVPATLIALLWIAVRRGINQSTAPFVAQLLTLDVAVVGIVVLVDVFRRGQGVQQVGVVAAIALMGAFFWDLLTSGSRVTNVDGRRIRRYVRVLVYVAYTLFIATVALLFATETYVDGGVPTIVRTLNGEQLARVGLLFLGVPLIVTTFMLRVSRWRGGGAE